MLYIGDNFRISADAYNVIIEKYITTSPKQKDVKPQQKWVKIGFYTTLPKAVVGLLRHCEKESDKNNVRDFLAELRDIEEKIKESVKHVQIIERKEDMRGKYKREEKELE